MLLRVLYRRIARYLLLLIHISLTVFPCHYLFELKLVLLFAPPQLCRCPNCSKSNLDPENIVCVCVCVREPARPAIGGVSKWNLWFSHVHLNKKCFDSLVTILKFDCNCPVTSVLLLMAFLFFFPELFLTFVVCITAFSFLYLFTFFVFFSNIFLIFASILVSFSRSFFNVFPVLRLSL